MYLIVLGLLTMYNKSSAIDITRALSMFGKLMPVEAEHDFWAINLHYLAKYFQNKKLRASEDLHKMLNVDFL